MTDLVVELVGLRRELLLALTERLGLGLARLGLVALAGLEELADLLGHRVDLRPQVVALAGQRPELFVELQHPVEGAQVGTPARQSGTHDVGFGTDLAQVEHGADGSGGQCFRGTRLPRRSRQHDPSTRRTLADT